MVDVLIITAADGEDAAVRDVNHGALSEWKQTAGPLDHAFPTWRREYAGVQGRLDVALMRTVAMGGDGAALTIGHAVAAFRPRCLAMCGVCAGRPEWTTLGDVVIADKVWRYDVGERVNELAGGTPTIDHDLVSYPIRAQWVELARRFSPENTRELLESRPSTDPPSKPWQIHVGSIATGNNLVRDVDIWRQLAARDRMTHALDMEASIVGMAAHHLGIADIIVAKGVMDHAEPRRSQGFRKFAARAASEVLLSFLRSHLRPGSRPHIDEDEAVALISSVSTRRWHPDIVDDELAIELAQLFPSIIEIKGIIDLARRLLARANKTIFPLRFGAIPVSTPEIAWRSALSESAKMHPQTLMSVLVATRLGIQTEMRALDHSIVSLRAMRDDNR